MIHDVEGEGKYAKLDDEIDGDENAEFGVTELHRDDTTDNNATRSKLEGYKNGDIDQDKDIYRKNQDKHLENSLL